MFIWADWTLKSYLCTMLELMEVYASLSLSLLLSSWAFTSPPVWSIFLFFFYPSLKKFPKLDHKSHLYLSHHQLSIIYIPYIQFWLVEHNDYPHSANTSSSPPPFPIRLCINGKWQIFLPLQVLPHLLVMLIRVQYMTLTALPCPEIICFKLVIIKTNLKFHS